MHKVVFLPSGIQGFIKGGKTLREVARELGVNIESICGGKLSCGKCRVQILEGYFDKYKIKSEMRNLSPIDEKEEMLFSLEELASGYRLSCNTIVDGDVLVFVPEESRGDGQIVRKAAGDIDIEINPAVISYYVELERPTFESSVGDMERLFAGLKSAHRLEGLTIDPFVLRNLPKLLRDSEWKVTAVVWHGREVISVLPGYREKRAGVALDIGTTTVVGYLTDLETGKVIASDSMMNPQVPYGEDVMSRITYSVSNEKGLETLHSIIVDGLNKIIKNVTAKAGLSPEDILDIVVVGNTCMHHLFLKINPRSLGVSPFSPALHNSLDIKAREIGLNSALGAYVHVLSIVAGFVGADNIGVLLAVEPEKKSEVTLVIDIGTNGEIVLGNKKKLLCTSCATGPAFEGAHIKFGMRAASGAIERVKINPDTYDVNYKVIGDVKPKGICGSGIITVAAEMLKVGIIRKNGTFNSDLKTKRLRRGRSSEYEFVLAWAKETGIKKDIVVTLSDVRAIQLAKGALYAGCKVLMRRYGVNEVDRVLLAGAFGSYIDTWSSLAIGMFPDCDLKEVKAIGNAAGDGARIALLDQSKREQANNIARQIHYVELTVDPDFETEFVKAMHFPHMEDKFPHIKAKTGG